MQSRAATTSRGPLGPQFRPSPVLAHQLLPEQPELRCLLVQHERLCRCLADAGWPNIELHLFSVGHTGAMGLDNAPALLELGVPPSQPQPSLKVVAVMGCKSKCGMLKAYWLGPVDVSVPSPTAPNLAALQNLLSGTARRPSSRIPGAAARRPARQSYPQHGAVRRRQQLTVQPLPSVHENKPTMIHPCPPLPVHLHLTCHPLKNCTEARD